jgi:hypothetical protein
VNERDQEGDERPEPARRASTAAAESSNMNHVVLNHTERSDSERLAVNAYSLGIPAGQQSATQQRSG